jgi:hypothetical protein
VVTPVERVAMMMMMMMTMVVAMTVLSRIVDRSLYFDVCFYYHRIGS